jgi:hypothetical protein
VLFENEWTDAAGGERRPVIKKYTVCTWDIDLLYDHHILQWRDRRR